MFDIISKRVKNDLYLGLCFVILFSSFNALSNVQKTITASIQQDDPTYNADGYISLGIVYTAMSIFMWISPAIIAKTGPKYAMVIGTFFYGFFIATFYTENSTWVYFGSALCGIGASILWTGQANYIVLNADEGKVYSGIGLFWILFQASHFLGNIIIYFEFNDVNRIIDRDMRKRIITMLLGFICVGVLMMLAIQSPNRKNQTTIKRNPCTEVIKSSKILISPLMLLLYVTLICLGVHLTFLSVLSASMGFSKYLSDNSKELAPLGGLLQGFGEIIGGILSIILGGKTIFQFKPLITLACVFNILGYIIALLVLPDNSANFYTNDFPIISLPTGFLMAASIFVGIGDACFHTELFIYIGAMYPDDSAPAFAVLNFITCIATAGSFYYGRYLNLHPQIIILLGLTSLSWITYHFIHWFMVKSSPEPATSVQNDQNDQNEHNIEEKQKELTIQMNKKDEDADNNY